MSNFIFRAGAVVALALNFGIGGRAAESSDTPLQQAVHAQSAQYRNDQWTRLSQRSDRDSLIAAAALSLPSAESDAPQKYDESAARLAKRYGNDPLALFLLAVGCQLQQGSCSHPQYYESLTRRVPDNAVNWLLIPNRGAPSAAQLHSGASATTADSQLREVLKIVRSTLAGQPAVAPAAGVDPNDLAAALRRDAADQVSLPYFGAVVHLCKTPPATQRGDCVELGRKLFDDESGTILTRMVGGAMLRRLVKGTAEDSAAKEFRRDYVWLDQQTQGHTGDYDREQEETSQYGEWEAWLRQADRMNIARKPPAGWAPSDPQLLLLSEERTPSK